MEREKDTSRLACCRSFAFHALPASVRNDPGNRGINLSAEKQENRSTPIGEESQYMRTSKTRALVVSAESAREYAVAQYNIKVFQNDLKEIKL
jgi:ssDNA-binding replication factor A large subunit